MVTTVTQNHFAINDQTSVLAAGRLYFEIIVYTGVFHYAHSEFLGDMTVSPTYRTHDQFAIID